MARPENPIDPHAPYAAFAQQLRTLRDLAGSPPYKAMARGTGYSVAALSQAANGWRLPSLKVTLAYTTACNGSEQYWRAQWVLASRGEAARFVADSAGSTTPPEPSAAAHITDFIDCLRALKIWAGDPAYEMVARSSGWSKSTIADALAPDRTRLPSLDLVRAIVEGILRAGHQDPASDGAYLEKWKQAWVRLATAERIVRRPKARAVDSAPSADGEAGTQATEAPPMADHVGLHPLAEDLPQETHELATALRALFSSLQISTRRYAARHHADPGALSRYLSGRRVPPRWFIEGLIADVSETRGGLTPETAAHIHLLYMAAMKATVPEAYKIAVLEEQVSTLQTHLTEALEELRILRDTA